MICEKHVTGGRLLTPCRQGYLSAAGSMPLCGGRRDAWGGDGSFTCTGFYRRPFFRAPCVFSAIVPCGDRFHFCDVATICAPETGKKMSVACGPPGVSFRHCRLIHCYPYTFLSRAVDRCRPPPTSGCLLTSAAIILLQKPCRNMLDSFRINFNGLSHKLPDNGRHCEVWYPFLR